MQYSGIKTKLKAMYTISEPIQTNTNFPCLQLMPMVMQKQTGVLNSIGLTIRLTRQGSKLGSEGAVNYRLLRIENYYVYKEEI